MDYSKDILTDFEDLFIAYTNTFLTGSSKFNKNILLKKEHSLMVRQECRQLAEAENLTGRMAAIIEIAGLFHDIGRFEQLREFNTFVDCKSIDHGSLGCKVLVKTKMLDLLPENDRNIIFTVTEIHNKRQLPDNLTPETLLVAQAVRDTDKLDIMRVLLSEYAKGTLDKTVILHLEESDSISPQVLAHLEQNKNPSHSDFRTLTDFKLAQLAWIYDLNFTHSLREFRKRRFYEQVTGYLPDTPQINTLCGRMHDYLNAKIAI